MSGWQRVMTQLVSDRGSALKGYGFLLCGTDAEAADLVQEALVRVFARPRAGWTVQDAEAYVRRAMLNYFLDERRRSTRWSALMPRLRHDDPERDIAPGATERLDILGALQTLSPRQRACVVLRFYEDRSVHEIAEQLRCSEGTIKRHLSDANVRLRVQLSVS